MIKNSPIQKHFDDVEMSNFAGIRGKKGRDNVRQRKEIKTAKRTAKVDLIKEKTKSIGTLAAQGVEFKGAGSNLLQSAGGIISGVLGGAGSAITGLLGGSSSTKQAPIQEGNAVQQNQVERTAPSINEGEENTPNKPGKPGAEPGKKDNTVLIIGAVVAIAAIMYLKKK